MTEDTRPTGWDVSWSHGEKGEPAVQVHWYDDATVILRQGKRSSYEAPFLVLLLGSQRALLLDTGARKETEHWPLRPTVDAILADRPASYRLVVAHTHGHGDHTAGDEQFAGRPNTTVVGAGLDDVEQFFGLDGWPQETATFDLGDRAISLIPSPGHHRAAVTFYDPASQILFTGDTVLPGRLYVSDATAYLATLRRLEDFCAHHPVSWLLGCHVEVARDGREYPLGRVHQPDEAPPQLPPEHLGLVRRAFEQVADRRGVHRVDGLVIYNEPRFRDVAGLQLAALRDRLGPGRR